MKTTRMGEYQVRNLQDLAIALAKHVFAQIEHPTDEQIEQILAVQFDCQRTRADK